MLKIVMERLGHTSCLMALLVLFAASAFAQSYPTKPVRIVTPFPPGGSADVLGRAVADKLAEAWRQPVLVESRPGGNTIIAANHVAQSAPDGYTLFLPIDFTLALAKSLFAKLPYDPDQAFAPITMLATQPLLLFGNPQKLPAQTLQDLIKHAKANPGKLNVGVGAIVSQLFYEAIKAEAGVNAEVINYRGSQPTTVALVAGDVNFAVDALLTHMPFIKEGRTVALVVSSNARMVQLPQTPTVAEQGFPQLEMSTWFALVAPGRTPKDIIDKVNAGVSATLAMPDVRARMSEYAMTVGSSTPEELQATAKAFGDKWAPVVKRAGLRLD
ncbi:MAG: Bug family tripartite tricarboxylate transporter substrate binding protein [Burkholderiales bacterium]